jgi:hypothetical protein
MRLKVYVERDLAVGIGIWWAPWIPLGSRSRGFELSLLFFGFTINLLVYDKKRMKAITYPSDSNQFYKV